MSEQLHVCVYLHAVRPFAISHELGEVLQSKWDWDIERALCPTELLDSDFDSLKPENPDLSDEIEELRKYISALRGISYDYCVFETY